MRVLIACEESQAVCKAFREKGHDAYSCDVLDCSGGRPQWHIKDDVLKHLNNGWDMVIAFPPCTHLAISGSRHFEKKKKDGRQKQGIDFFMQFANYHGKIAIENPVGIMSTVFRRPDQIIQPYYFGDPFQKTTCLWLQGISKLVHRSFPDLFGNPVTHVDKGEFVIVGPKNKKIPKWYHDARIGDYALNRSKTFPGIVQAMADQWG